MPVNFPSLSDLGQMEFMSPIANQQAQQQIGLANQFAQGDLQKQQQELQALVLKNLFDSQNNPLKLQSQTLQNEQQGYTNQVEKTKATEFNSPEAIDARRSKFIADASDEKLKTLMARTQKDMLSDDPSIANAARDMYMRSAQEMSARAKHKDEMEKTQAEIQGRKDVANINAGATLGAARISADARSAAATARNKSIIDQISTKPPQTQYAAYTALAQRASMMGDAESASLYGNMAESVKPQVEAGLNARPDPSKLNVPGVTGMAGQAPIALPSNPYAGGGAPAPAARPSAAPSNIPVGAVEMLKKRPELRKQFDEKYGAGASARILGN